jgi:dienelactone hydrolase
MVCKDCVSGVLAADSSKGTESKIHGFDVYTAYPVPENPKGIVVIIPDAFGWRFPNLRVLADAYAAKGDFLVYMPEFMDGMQAFYMDSISYNDFSLVL